jgi:hypothetical protein
VQAGGRPGGRARRPRARAEHPAPAAGPGVGPPFPCPNAVARSQTSVPARHLAVFF